MRKFLIIISTLTLTSCSQVHKPMNYENINTDYEVAENQQDDKPTDTTTKIIPNKVKNIIDGETKTTEDDTKTLEILNSVSEKLKNNFNSYKQLEDAITKYVANEILTGVKSEELYSSVETVLETITELTKEEKDNILTFLESIGE